MQTSRWILRIGKTAATHQLQSSDSEETTQFQIVADEAGIHLKAETSSDS